MIDRLQKDNRWVTYLIYILIRKSGEFRKELPAYGFMKLID